MCVLSCKLSYALPTRVTLEGQGQRVQWGSKHVRPWGSTHHSDRWKCITKVSDERRGEAWPLNRVRMGVSSPETGRASAHAAQALTHPRVNQQGKVPPGGGPLGKQLATPAAQDRAAAEPGSPGDLLVARSAHGPGAASTKPRRGTLTHHRHPLWENRKRLHSGNRNHLK